MDLSSGRERNEEAIPLVSMGGGDEKISSLPGRASARTSGPAYPHIIEGQQLPAIPANDQRFMQDAGDINQTKTVPPQTHRQSLTDDYDDYDSGLMKPSTAKASQPSNFEMWSSKWLHPATLIGFFVLFIALLLALVLLFHFSNQNHGLSTQISANHYSWTYGPTALLVLVLSTWRQVDFNCRILAPWKHSMEAPSVASRSLLLDYVSPILPNTLWMSFRQQDWEVFASTLAILILRLVIVFSTGLLVLTPTKLTQENSPFVINSTFIGGTYNDTGQSTTLPEAASGEALNVYYGIHKQGLDYPYGSQPSLAYETIEVNSQIANSTITATVNGFYPQFDCEMTPVTVNFTWEANQDLPDQPNLDFIYTAQPPGCQAIRAYMRPCDPVNKGGSTVAQGCPTEKIYASFIPYDPNFYSNILWGQPPAEVPDRCNSFWIWTFANFHYARVEGVPSNTTKGWNINYSNLTSLTCFPSYSIQPVNVTIDITNFTEASHITLSEPLDRTSTLLENLSRMNFSQDMAIEVQENAPGYNDSLALFLLANSSLVETDLIDPPTLKDTAETALTGFAAQAATRIMRVKGHRNVEGATSYQEQRLQIRTWIVWVMLSCFIILAVCALVVLAFRGRKVVPRNPNSIATNAAVLVASPDLNALLSATRNLPQSELRRRLQHTRTETDGTQLRTSSGFSVRILHPSGEHVENARDKMTVPEWWKPWSITIPFMIWAILLPISVIVTLEILHRLSDSQDGFVNISSSSVVSHSAASVITSLVMITIAMSYESIEFGMSTLGPYQTLHSGHTTAGRSLIRNSFGQLPLLTIVDAIRDQRFFVALASLAATIGSFLTIIASGLYVAETVPLSTNTTITTADYFGTYWNSSSGESSIAGTTYGLIEHENASYPSYTHKQLAFPSFGLASLPQTDGSMNTSMQLTLPARRASLNCTVAPKENITFQTMAQGTSTGYVYYTNYVFTFGVPASCPEFRNLSDDVVSSISFDYSIDWSFPNDTNLIYPYGAVPNYFDFNVDGALDANYTPNTIGAASNAPGCPSLAFLLGRFEQQHISAENVTAMLCVQGLEEVDALTTVALPDMTIDTSNPPVVDEASARWVVAEDYIGTFYGQGLTFRSYNEDPGFALEGGAFFQTVMYGTDGVPFDELVGEANQERLVEAVTDVYRKYMAQVISENMRVPYSEGDAAAPSYAAYLPDARDQVRLVQNSTSKIVLQVLLGVMVACALVVYASSWGLRRLLPRCPWSMAGVMALLADGEVVSGRRRVMPVGAEFMGDKELEGKLEGWVFGLGWWEGKGGKRYGIDVGEALAGGGGEKRRRRGRGRGDGDGDGDGRERREGEKRPLTSAVRDEEMIR